MYDRAQLSFATQWGKLPYDLCHIAMLHHALEQLSLDLMPRFAPNMEEAV